MGINRQDRTGKEIFHAWNWWRHRVSSLKELGVQLLEIISIAFEVFTKSLVIGYRPGDNAWLTSCIVTSVIPVNWFSLVKSKVACRCILILMIFISPVKVLFLFRDLWIFLGIWFSQSIYIQEKSKFKRLVQVIFSVFIHVNILNFSIMSWPKNRIEFINSIEIFL